MSASYDELALRLETLTARMDELEAENAQLRANAAGTNGSAAAAAPASRIDRRNLLRLGGVAAALGAGTMMLRPEAAGATTSAMNFGAANDAGTDTTGLTSSNATDTLHVANTSTGGSSGVGLTVHNSDAANTAAALNAIHDGTGETVTAHATNAGNTSAVIHTIQDGGSDAIVGEVTTINGGAGVVGLGIDSGGVVGVTAGAAAGVAAIAYLGSTGSALLGQVVEANNAAPTLEVEHDGKGQGVYVHLETAANTHSAVNSVTKGTGASINGSVNNANSKAAAVQGSTNGSGPGLSGTSAKGVGGLFKGATAQVQLTPSALGSHPASGSAGQLFVDHSGRLWYCRGGKTWKQLA